MIISSRKFPRKSQEILGKKISQEIPVKFQGKSCGEILTKLQQNS